MILFCWWPFFDPGGTGSESCWEALPLSQVLGLSPRSCSGITAAGHGQEAEGFQSTLPCAWGGEDHSFPRGLCTMSLRESSVTYTISLLRGICIVSRCVPMCVHVYTHTGHNACLHLHNQCCNKHPDTGVLWRMLLFLGNIFPGVQLLGQKPYVFLIWMDFSRLISKKITIIYTSTSNDSEHTFPPYAISVGTLFNIASLQGPHRILLF